MGWMYSYRLSFSDVSPMHFQLILIVLVSLKAQRGMSGQSKQTCTLIDTTQKNKMTTLSL